MKTNKGQSIIEYVAIAMLVIVATVVMGPHIIRAVGSHFKIWQEEISDSAHDRMLQDPQTLNMICTPQPREYQGCAGQKKNEFVCGVDRTVTSKQDLIQCAVYERYFEETGKPAGCYYCGGCNYDLTCCEKYLTKQQQGNSVDNTPECGTKQLQTHSITDYLTFQNKLTTTGDSDRPYAPRSVPYLSNWDQTINLLSPVVFNHATEPDSNSCYYGEEVMRNNCFRDWTTGLPQGMTVPPVPPIKCKLNPKCDPTCNGNAVVGSLTCGTSTPAGAPHETMNKDMNLSYHSDNASCPTPQADPSGSADCTAYCQAPFAPKKNALGVVDDCAFSLGVCDYPKCYWDNNIVAQLPSGAYFLGSGWSNDADGLCKAWGYTTGTASYYGTWETCDDNYILNSSYGIAVPLVSPRGVSGTFYLANGCTFGGSYYSLSCLWCPTHDYNWKYTGYTFYNPSCGTPNQGTLCDIDAVTNQRSCGTNSGLGNYCWTCDANKNSAVYQCQSPYQSYYPNCPA